MSSAATKQRAALETEYVSMECGFCGVKVGQHLAHYDRVRCVCGKLFWALRPKRDGRLVLFPCPDPIAREAA